MVSPARVLPHNLEAEMSVLGAILQSNDALLKCLELLQPTHFYRDAHRKIFAAAKDLFQRSEPVDLITITNDLRRRGELEDVGAAAFLASLVEAVPTAANVAFHAKIVRGKAETRHAAELGLQLYEAASVDDGWRERLTALAAFSATSRIEANRGDVPILVRLSDVAPEPVRWLWPGRIPRGKLSLLIGDPGQGKSMLTLDLVARVSRGHLWPDGGRAPRGAAVLLTAEDGLADTVRPRLDAMDGDAERVVVVTGIRRGGDAEPHPFCLASDVRQLEEVILTSEAILAVIDPLTAYLGKTDSYKDSEVRGVLAPLAALAERTGSAVVAIMHLTKDAQRNVLYRAQGSLGFVAAARSVFAVATDNDNPTLRLLLPIKLNLGPTPPGLAFRLTGLSLAWESEPVEVNVQGVLGGPWLPEERAERKDASEVLHDLLADGPRRAAEVTRLAGEAGISERTLSRARAMLAVKAKRIGGFGKEGWWELELPAPKAAKNATSTIGENLATLGEIGSLSKLEEVEL